MAALTETGADIEWGASVAEHLWAAAAAAAAAAAEAKMRSAAGVRAGETLAAMA